MLSSHYYKKQYTDKIKCPWYSNNLGNVSGSQFLVYSLGIPWHASEVMKIKLLSETQQSPKKIEHVAWSSISFTMIRSNIIYLKNSLCLIS